MSSFSCPCMFPVRNEKNNNFIWIQEWQAMLSGKNVLTMALKWQLRKFISFLPCLLLSSSCLKKTLLPLEISALAAITYLYSTWNLYIIIHVYLKIDHLPESLKVWSSRLFLSIFILQKEEIDDIIFMTLLYLTENMSRNHGQDSLKMKISKIVVYLTQVNETRKLTEPLINQQLCLTNCGSYLSRYWNKQSTGIQIWTHCKWGWMWKATLDHYWRASGLDLHQGWSDKEMCLLIECYFN